MTDMHDLSGWTEVSCSESNELRFASSGVSSSLTDPDGQYGDPVVFTEWHDANGDPLLRDYRSGSLVDGSWCTHYVRAGGS